MPLLALGLMLLRERWQKPNLAGAREAGEPGSGARSDLCGEGESGLRGDFRLLFHE